MGKYVPGERIAAFTDTVRPSVAAETAFEHGFYDADYVVVMHPKTPLRPELEAIRHAAATKWPQENLVAFSNIVEWVGEGAPDLLTGDKVMGASPLDPQKRAVLLINNGLFERHW